jgi:hypothetical protein
VVSLVNSKNRHKKSRAVKKCAARQRPAGSETTNIECTSSTFLLLPHNAELRWDSKRDSMSRGKPITVNYLFDVVQSTACPDRSRPTLDGDDGDGIIYGCCRLRRILSRKGSVTKDAMLLPSALA